MCTTTCWRSATWKPGKCAAWKGRTTGSASRCASTPRSHAVPTPDEELAEFIALREAGRAEDARPRFVALAADYPNHAQVQYQAGWVHDLLGLESDAVPYYQRALALGLPEPDRAGLLLSLGSTYRNIGRHAEAVATLGCGIR